MKKIQIKKGLLLFVLGLATTLTLTGCHATTQQGSSEQGKPAQQSSSKRLATDHATVQRKDSTMPTRVIKHGTKIRMHFGKTVITGVLNDSKTAKALIAKMPYTIHESRYDTDFCGTIPALPYNKSEVHYGWLNGDIDYATDAPYFTILFNGEKQSNQYGHQVNIGVITTPLAKIRHLQGSYNIRIELDHA